MKIWDLSRQQLDSRNSLSLFPKVTGRFAYKLFRLQVVSPTSRFAYFEVVSPTQQKSFRLHGPSRFTYTKYLLLDTKYLSKNCK